MDLWFVHPDGIRSFDAAQLTTQLERTDGFVWVDAQADDEQVERLLTEVVHAHPLVVAACRQRNHVPTLHGYADHVFVVLHSPFAGDAGHVHLLELDQLVGRRYLVTVHGPINPVVDPAESVRETVAVRGRIERGTFRPTSPAELSHAIGSAVVRSQREVVSSVAESLPALEQLAMSSDFRRPEELLERLFLIRHELITVRTMSAQSHEIYARIRGLDRVVPEVERSYAGDLAEQFDRLRSLADGESHFLFGVIDLYQTRVTTKMTVAMERLAVIAAITLPVTALASIYGMNVIVNDSTHLTQLVLVLLVMASISGLLLRWTKKQGWW
ncbi:magnesium transporter CorA family protein [Nocardioides sp.]|uniref:magnesium transporter CorA family protein n=1 Tax=Nocardioides sp. TaxID=35761 RepID=UPI0035AF19D3